MSHDQEEILERELQLSDFLRQKFKSDVKDLVKNKVPHSANLEIFDEVFHGLSEPFFPTESSLPVGFLGGQSVLETVTCESCKLFSDVSRSILDNKAV